MTEPIRAAGAVAWRRQGDRVEVLLVHRPRYDDWSWPKGKRERGETDEQCAVREVREESGVQGRLGPELLSTSYRDRKGRTKVVRYWAIEAAGTPQFHPNDEVDAVRWLSVPEAAALVSYPRDAEVLRSFTATVPEGSGVTQR